MNDLTREVSLALRANTDSRNGVISSSSAPKSSNLPEVPLSGVAHRTASFDFPFAAPMIGSSSSARITRDRPESASDCSNPNPVVITLIVLESAVTKKSAAAHKKDAELLQRRVEALVTDLYPAALQRVTVAKSSAYSPGMIIGMSTKTHY